MHHYLFKKTKTKQEKLREIKESEEAQEEWKALHA
jgi:hypothetical protein